jgi:selenocysteine lyase/cysteine desulfurase
VYLSHVFFNSGWAVPSLSRVVGAIPSADTFVVVDGYHAFLALPVDLGALQDRVFYVAGGYKYAMSGEGVCFLHAPAGYGARPRDTGWYAAFGALAHAQSPGRVAYAPGGARFLGATFDPTAIFRFVAVNDWLDGLRVGASEIHAHAVDLQELFVAALAKEGLPLSVDQLVVPLSETSRGQFLTFETPRAAEMHARLTDANVVTDVRGDRLRFGFGLYQDETDIARAIERMRRVLST